MDSSPRPAGRPRRPALFDPGQTDSYLGYLGGDDPAELVEAAHATAEALVRHGRDGDAARTARLVALADECGIDEVALLWADRPADSLPGALWRLYALRAGIRSQSDLIARAYDAGRHRVPVHEVVAGVAEPPGPREVRELADAVLAGAFTADLGVALERAGAFCRIVAVGWALLADTADADTAAADIAGALSADAPSAATAMTRRASDLMRTGAQLESAARRWRDGTLH